MGKDRPEILKLAKEFVELCDKNDIGYTVDCGSMLGAIRHKGIIPGDDDFDVMMTPESFKKLLALFPDRIISTDTANYPLLIPKFMYSKNDFLTSAVFVDIFIAVPSTLKKVKKFRSLPKQLRFANQCVHSTGKPFNGQSKLFQILSGPVQGMPKRLTYQEAHDILFDENADGVYTIDNPTDPLKLNGQVKLSGERTKVPFEDFEVYVPKEYESILINKYTDKGMIPNKQERSIEHINAVSIVKVKR